MPEMESWIRRGYRSRSRGRDEERDDGGMGRSRGGEGTHCPDKGIGALKPAADTTCGINPSSEENMWNSSKKDRLPIKKLIEEEMAKEFEPKRASSSVVARLMGLDAFPIPRSGHINKKESEKCIHRASMVGLRERHVSSADHSFTSVKDQQQLKDAFEAYNTYRVDKHQNSHIEKDTPKRNRSENDIKFVRQKFLDAKRLATNGKLYDSKDFNEALDVLDSNKDIFLKILQEPSSLFTKHLHDLHQVPSKPQLSNITILRPSKSTDRDFPSNWPSEKEVGSQMQRKCNANASRNIDSDMICHSSKEQSLSRSCKVAKSKSEGKGGVCSLPTRIVVLKPTVERVQISDSVSFPSCTEKSPFVYRKQKEHRSSHSHKLFPNVRECQKLSDDLVFSLRTDSTLNPQQASKHMKHIVTNESLDESVRNRGVHKMKEKFTLVHGRTFQEQSSGHYDNWKRNIKSPLHSSESSLGREARKRLSERWRISNRFQKEQFFKLANQGSNTLGEMLSLSDKEIFTHDFKNEMHPIWDHPSSESRDGHKGEYSRRLARSRSLPGSSFQVNSRRNRTASFVDGDYVILKDILNHVSDKSPKSSKIHKEAMPFGDNASSSKPPSINPVTSEENEVTLHEIHVKSDGYHASFLTEDKHEFSETSAAVYYDAVALIDDNNDVESAQVSCNLIESELPSCDVSVESMEDATTTTCKNLISEETLVRQCHDVTIDNCHASEPESPTTREHGFFVISKDAEQPSPVSVLEPVDEEEEDTSPECFERLNTDIQGLRLQLQLLRMESNCEGIDGSDVSCDDETVMDGIIFPQSTEILGVSTDKDERDFSYLLDMLADSGLQDATLDMVSAVCHLPECPVSPVVFEKLEKIYEEPLVWTRSERKLMFDLINFLLTDLFAPHMDLRPWIKPPRRIRVVNCQKVTADELWHLFIERREKLTCDPSELVMDEVWWDLGDVTDVMGMEIEKMLRDELLDEIVSELLT